MIQKKELVPLPDYVAQLPVLNGDVAVVESLLLLTVHEAAALEAAADRYGLTVGQMARHLIRDFLESGEGSCASASVVLPLREFGFENGHALEGGFDAWQTANGSVERK